MPRNQIFGSNKSSAFGLAKLLNRHIEGKCTFSPQKIQNKETYKLEKYQRKLHHHEGNVLVCCKYLTARACVLFDGMMRFPFHFRGSRGRLLSNSRSRHRAGGGSVQRWGVHEKVPVKAATDARRVRHPAESPPMVALGLLTKPPGYLKPPLQNI